MLDLSRTVASHCWLGEALRERLRRRSLQRSLKKAMIAAGLLVMWLAPSAEADGIYWTNPISGTIGRSNLDGTGVNQNLVSGPTEPGYLAVDGTYIYWTDSSAIGRANLDGTGVNVNFIPDPDGPGGIAIDGTHIYWTNFFPETISRANLDGTGVNQSFITGASSPLGVAVDGTHIYWVNGNSSTIGRANLDGTGVNQGFISVTRHPKGIAVDGRYVYWASVLSGAGAIGRANLDGTGVNEDFITGLFLPFGVAVDGTYIYFADAGGQIGRANLDGTGVNRFFIPSILVPLGIAVVLPEVPVQIEVEPFVPKDPIILNSPLPVPVAVLGSSTVDVTQIDATTLRFGPKGATPLFTQVVTFNGQKDLLALFKVQDTGLALGDTQACLQGKIGGQAFRGCDDVVVILARGCGLGFELAPILPALLWLRGRRRRKLA